MTRCRLKLAIEELNKALDCSGKRQRDYILIAIHHLICWLVGKIALPPRNAISEDEDSIKYCDICFKQKWIKYKEDHLDLCMECFKKRCKNNPSCEREKSVEAETVRVQAALKAIDTARTETYRAMGHTPVCRKNRRKPKPQSL